MGENRLPTVLACRGFGQGVHLNGFDLCTSEQNRVIKSSLQGRLNSNGLMFKIRPKKNISQMPEIDTEVDIFLLQRGVYGPTSMCRTSIAQ